MSEKEKNNNEISENTDETVVIAESGAVKEEKAEPASPEKTEKGKKPQKVSGKKQDTDNSRKNKFRITSMVLTAIVLAGVIIVNVIAFALTDRFSALTADITSNGTFNLSDSTYKLLDGVKKKVSITFLMQRKTYEMLDSTYYKQCTNLVDKMVQDSNGFISVDYVDIVSNPNFVNDYPDDNLQTSDVIIRCGKKYNVLHKEDLYNYELMNNQYQYITSTKAESAIDTAIVKVTSDRSDKIVLLTDNSTDSHDYLSRILTANNYEVVSMEIEKADIPENVNTVIVFAPTKDYSETAVKKLNDFLYNDGNYNKSMVYIAYRNKANLANIDKLLDSYGLAVTDGLAFDMDTSRQMSSLSAYSAYRYIAASFASKLYTNNISAGGQTVLADYARGVYPTNDDVTQKLVTYSSNSGVCPFDVTDDWNPQDYITGNVCIMMQGAAGNDKAISKLIVSGSTEMWNQTIMESQFVNQEYLMNIFDNLNHREDNSIRLEDKVITDYSLQGISRQTSVIVGIIMFAVIPVLIVGAGIMVYVARRRR